ncbi:hypothetical protein M422DRAFT_23770 [Sphaerobolus stellatus SS14]|nr:hypothetical protein M422DRAFT_23770 [Sphaerobolus stellatus SS14]
MRPRECVDEVLDWIKQERETRAKLKKEKEEVRIRHYRHRIYAKQMFLHLSQKEAREKKEVCHLHAPLPGMSIHS